MSVDLKGSLSPQIFLKILLPTPHLYFDQRDGLRRVEKRVEKCGITHEGINRVEMEKAEPF
jgi:hypothetical protein